MKLYGYWRSTAAYRVRIALYLKGIDFESVPVHLVKNGGEQYKDDYTAINPNQLVPTLIDDDLTLHQSLAIIDYLESAKSGVSLYPDCIKDVAKVRAFALNIACEIHPLNNLRVQQYLVDELNLLSDAKLAWIKHWMVIGFNAIEKQLIHTSGCYCFKDQITVADICLIPQVYNANRFNIDMNHFPYINRVVDNCSKLEAFQLALPENQADAQL
ncbi:maleylacetoacetate isomerase [Colwellia sp. 4_MG-2023]|jgi:maleylacetoacetate isomerase/maleylpyruvate isomerase|uniref:maleylacetoacetate isomerase n=1 Tax=unclassified Colwellia TaxID=196834 RepID=UPI0026E3BC3D|nr:MULTISPECIES: maleylacetoacetate isomerase [unclassified Colwellia]MDO6506903.1 maleylacetoacetate isomerase [Colwellia sp. 5_MG-2023]MDO6556659.1 maleylacetoacetate isomerase [Colwellia sp. 4_MG-2023]